MKSTLVLLSLLGIAAARMEGSGESFRESHIDDIEVEGSGEEEYGELTLVPDREYSESDIHFDKNDRHTEEDYNELLNSYSYEYTDDNEDNSVLKVVEDTFLDVEIRPKPPNTDENSVLGAPQILIMVVSAFVSFIIVMLIFFMCQKTTANKKQKFTKVTVGSPINNRNEKTSIVKDYTRVPTDTQEYLQCKEDTHIDIVKEKGIERPLISSEQ